MLLRDAANTVSFFLPVSLLFVSRMHNYFRYVTGGGGGWGDRKQMCNCIFVGVTAKNLITAFLKIWSFLARGLR